MNYNNNIALIVLYSVGRTYEVQSILFSLLPTPYSLLPIPYSLFPIPYSLLPKT
ncbi:hypothetical protein [Moorena bouillonii]|uniref:hypothetical protein n=1 Tax=Moorena bouillonii TaxID=207920 RepID=UPI0018E9A51A|nr:hypothetical protein [Moorena bouillonii]